MSVFSATVFSSTVFGADAPDAVQESHRSGLPLGAAKITGPARPFVEREPVLEDEDEIVAVGLI